MAGGKYPQEILVVEDELAMANALVDNLHHAGFSTVHLAHNGEDGLYMALAKKPDLVILDIVMPRMDGMTMLKKLRENPAGKDVKVILLTNLSADDSIMQGVVKDEPSFYLVKAEFSIDDAITKVKEALGIKE